MDSYSGKQKEQMLNELDSPTVKLCCEDHQFYPGSKFSMPPAIGCKYCVLANFYYEFAKMPPHLREERLEALESLVNHMAEDVERGTFDITTFARPQITVEKVDDDKPNIILTDDASKD